MVRDLWHVVGLSMGRESLYYVPHIGMVQGPEAVAIIIVPSTTHQVDSLGAFGDRGKGSSLGLWDHLVSVTRLNGWVQVGLDEGRKNVRVGHYGFVYQVNGEILLRGSNSRSRRHSSGTKGVLSQVNDLDDAWTGMILEMHDDDNEKDA